jgi:hypothetical protein
MRLGQNRKIFSFFSVLATLWAEPLPFTTAAPRGAGEGVDGVDMAVCLRVLTPDISDPQRNAADGGSDRCRVCPFRSRKLSRMYSQRSGGPELVDRTGEQTQDGRKVRERPLGTRELIRRRRVEGRRRVWQLEGWTAEEIRSYRSPQGRDGCNLSFASPWLRDVSAAD